jgi:tRNA uridine 5-carboxymethylaminomethyl modification enzyme
LTPLARKLGLVSDAQWRRYSESQERIEGERKRFRKTSIKPTAASNQWLETKLSSPILDSVPLAELIRRPELDYKMIAELFPGELELSTREEFRLETELKFAGYLVRQNEEIERMKRMEDVCIPSGFSYLVLKTLSVEVREKLEKVQPRTLGQASRISGVTPAALSLLAVYLRKSAKSSLQTSPEL